MPTTTCVWQLANVQEEEFAATVSLFAHQTQGKSVCIPPLAVPGHDNGDSSEEEDNDEDWQTDAPFQNLHPAAENNLRRNRFLNRLAEVLAREKSVPSHQKPPKAKPPKAKHVAAAAWIESGRYKKVTILLAKNEGFDDRDNTMLDSLQQWLRLFSDTGKDPSLDRDIWIGLEENEGLIQYSRDRLLFYISQISQCKIGLGAAVLDASPSGRFQCLYKMCKKSNSNATVSSLEKIVNLAYELRKSGDWRHLKPLGAKVVNTVLMLGRIRDAYECFKTTALSFPNFKSVELKRIHLSPEDHFDSTKFKEQVQHLAKETGQKLPGNTKPPSQLHVHAEMQLLFCLESGPKWRKSAYHYIGTSKKPCFLCYEFLRNYKRPPTNGLRAPAFYARRSHGKVYSLWTLPSIPDTAEAGVRHLLAAALEEVYAHVQKSLDECSAVLRQAMPESSAGISQSAASIDKDLVQLKRQYLDQGRIENSRPPESHEDGSDVFGHKLRDVRVIRLPADGSKPDMVLVPLHSVHAESTRQIPEYFSFAPDFREYWGCFHSDRKLTQHVLDEYPMYDFQFGYWIYHNGNNELPENECVKEILGISHIEPPRRFYYGDVFVMRFVKPQASEITVQNTTEATYSEVIASVKAEIRRGWDAEVLETKFREDQEWEAFRLKFDADKEILLQRMIPTEREKFKRMPQMLELLAVQACDDGALLSVEEIPSNVPGMVCIRGTRRLKESDSYGWTEVHSSQL